MEIKWFANSISYIFLGVRLGSSLVGGKGSVSLSDSGVIYMTPHKASHIDDIISNVYCKHSCNAFILFISEH